VIEFFRDWHRRVAAYNQEIAPEEIADPIMVLSVND
jgi:hypothetical protein